jgi:AcrR family transcriptional regulator
MPQRKYEQTLRAESAEVTRRRILDAFADQLRAAPTEPVSLDAVARRARVARSTIYTTFGSRSGLFQSFVEDLWSRTGLAALTDAVREPDAVDHLRSGITAASRMYAQELPIYRVLFSMARLDPDATGHALRAMEDNRAGGMLFLARHLDESGMLRPGLTVKTAADILWVLCSFDSLDTLLSDRDLPLDEAIDVLATSAVHTLCRPDAIERSTT